VARKEKERREKNRVEGRMVPIITEAELPGPADNNEDTLDEFPETTAPSETSRSTVRGNHQPDQGNRREFVDWRLLMRQARARVENARKNYEHFNSFHLMPRNRWIAGAGHTGGGVILVDTETNQPTITSVGQLREAISEAKAELDSATQALEDLREKARRAGVPPGRLR